MVQRILLSDTCQIWKLNKWFDGIYYMDIIQWCKSKYVVKNILKNYLGKFTGSCCSEIFVHQHWIILSRQFWRHAHDHLNKWPTCQVLHDHCNLYQFQQSAIWWKIYFINSLKNILLEKLQNSTINLKQFNFCPWMT